MRKLIVLSMFAVMLLMLGTVSAQLVPFPINGRVEGVNVQNLPIEVKSVRIGASIDIHTSPGGEFVADWSNTGYAVGPGDSWIITITSCEELPECVKTVDYDTILNNINVKEIPAVTFDLTDSVLPCRECQVCEDCAEDFTPYDEQSCLDFVCTVAETNDVEELFKYLVGAGIAGVAGLAVYLGRKKVTVEEQTTLEETLAKEINVGSGFRAYKHTDGKVRYKHLHRGILGYHDPQTSHRNPTYRHEKGELIV